MNKFEKLSKAEMRNVKGGNYPTPCTITCYDQVHGVLFGTTMAPNCDFNYITQCQGHVGWGGTTYATCTCPGQPA